MYSEHPRVSSGADAGQLSSSGHSIRVKFTSCASQTLDNLPAHLLTPFIGAVPPSNLLDKIARRVTEAKGNEWPHSLRATRAKIVELGRIRAKEARDESASDIIAEEEGSGADAPLQQTTNLGVKRPLYRQSSMDFLHATKPNIKDNANINRYVHH